MALLRHRLQTAASTAFRVCQSGVRIRLQSSDAPPFGFPRPSTSSSIGPADDPIDAPVQSASSKIPPEVEIALRNPLRRQAQSQEARATARGVSNSIRLPPAARAQIDQDTAADTSDSMRPTFGGWYGQRRTAGNTPEERWSTQRFMNYGPAPASTTATRTLNVSPGALDRAWGILNARMRADDLRGKFIRRQRYEDPKDKRRRLRSERHRIRFADAVGKKVKKVIQMKEMGM
jgi:Ribosomal protein S21